MGKDKFPLDVLLKVPYVESYEGFDTSPDGSTLAFSWNGTGQWEIYLLSLEGQSFPQQVTNGEGAKFAPLWSPDGRRLAYVLDPDGSEQYDIYTYNLDTGQHNNLTPHTPDAIQPGFSWSPDAHWIAFASDRAGRFDSYRIPLPGGPACKLFDLPYSAWKVCWSPNGRWIAVVVEAKGQDFNTFIVPIGGGEPFAIALNGEPLNAKDVAWSPEGDRLAFSSDLGGMFNVGLFHVESRQISWLTNDQEDKETPAWSSDGQRLAFVSARGPQTFLEVLDIEGKSTARFQVATGVHRHPHFTPDGEGLVFSFNNPQMPDDLWLLDLKDNSLGQLTHSMPEIIHSDSLVMPHEIQYPSVDGRSVPALLYLPTPSGKLPPAVIFIHGGPNWLTQVTWDAQVQHMVSRGWVVLAPNYRGSTGFGRDWQLANRYDMGGRDTQDIVAGADYLVREGIADQLKIAVTGRSYGGYLTMTSMTQYPSHWAGGSAMVPFLNWFTAHEGVREDLIHWDLENFGDPEKDHDLYVERSPFFYLECVQAPVQLICGAHDPRCPVGESIQARDRLHELGKPCDLVLYEDEGHSFLKTKNVSDAKIRQVNFLSSVLEN
jgi:dipeptidyl aminopeptidase/acylaminoacyl peptidase